MNRKSFIGIAAFVFAASLSFAGGPGGDNPTNTSSATPSVETNKVSKAFSVVLDNDMVTAQWFTTPEQANDYFSVQRSTNGLEWKPVYTVKAPANATTVRKHRYFDHNVEAGVTYYRLEQSNATGVVQQSEVQEVNTESTP